MALLLCLVVAYMIQKAWIDGRTDQELARKGIVSPRLQAKYGDGAKAKTDRYGLVDFLADAWSDQWRNRTEIRRAAVKAAAGVKPSKPGAAKPSWRDRFAAAKDAVTRFGKKVVQPVEAKPKPDPRPVDPTPVVDADPVDDFDSHRTCPACGQPLHPVQGAWWHPDGPACPATSPTPEPKRPEHPCAGCGRPFDEHVKTDLGRGEPDLVCPIRPKQTTDPDTDPAVCCRCGRPLHGRWKPSIGGSPVCRYGCHSAEQPPPRNCQCRVCRPDTQPDTSNGGSPVTAPTGEAVNYETTVAELEKLIEACQQWLDQVTAALKDCESAKNHIEDAQTGYKTAAAVAATIFDHLAALGLDATTLGLVGAIKESLPASDVDVVLALLEEAEVKLKVMRDNAQTALDAAQAALAHVIAEHGEDNANIARKLGGNPDFHRQGGVTTSAAA